MIYNNFKKQFKKIYLIYNKGMTDQTKKYAKGLTPEQKEERRKAQLRIAQQKFREKHGLIKPQLSDEEKQLKRKEKAKKRYLEKKEKKGKKPDQVPVSYTVDYQRSYHKNYYETNKEKIITRAKTRYFKKRTTDVINTYDNTEPVIQTTD
jgi:hypothetical protein